MCGIAGMIGLQTDEGTLQEMLSTMARRGPDEQGIYRNGS